jgi:alpha-mannosidase
MTDQPTSPAGEPRRPLYYTFGNHMHWVDMEWLWGYDVLPGSTRDMLAFCAAAGVRGNVNFDGVAYEKLAAEAPETLAALRTAVAAGQIEVVGASYGQPYGLFQGGESNARQRIYGARTVRRLLGVWPRTFWEEEFDFFPQLPQLLRGAGYQYGSLFFQWTWHTSEVPREAAPAVWWEGQDGSRLLSASRNALNLHQWPEDFEGLLESDALRTMPAAGLVQWLELMPSPDWMCRSELMLPPLRALQANPAFELRPVTLPEYLEAAREHAETRRYTLDDVFHGVTLGKNGDELRRLSRAAEQQVLGAEGLAALLGLFGRPYAHWDVYPTWELEEAWRELLAAQHHDNDCCEALCGHVGRLSYERSLGLSQAVVGRSLRLLAERAPGTPGRTVVYNPLGWTRHAVVSRPEGRHLVQNVPPFGYLTVEPGEALPRAPEASIEETETTVTLRRGTLSVTVDKARGVITQLASAEAPQGWLAPDAPLATLEMTRDGAAERFERASVRAIAVESDQPARVVIERWPAEGEPLQITVALAPELDAVDVAYFAPRLPRPDGGMHTALQTALAPDLPGARLIHDHPYALSEIKAQGTFRRKYPSGDWMTSPQVFETIRQPFTALQLLDFDAGSRGLLYLHDGSQAFFRAADSNEGRVAVRQILSAHDPWDEAYFVARLEARTRWVPHGPLSHTRRWQLAQAFTRPVQIAVAAGPGGDLPAAFGAVWCDAPNVVVTAFYREADPAGAHVDGYGGAGLALPFVARLVELDGLATRARLRLPSPVAAGFKTNLLGAVLEPLTPEPTEPPLPGAGEWQAVTLNLGPYEIATLYLDLALGRKQTRDLDAHRKVWATVHRVA